MIAVRTHNPPLVLMRLVALVLVFLLCAPLREVRAEETGTTSYAALYHALRPALQVDRYDRLQASANVQSKLPGVSPASIRMEIRARGGARKLVIGADGDFEFPMDEGLLAEDPAVASNQPKGSLTLSVTLALRPFPTLRVPYREIRKALTQAAELVAVDPGRNSAQVRGIEVWFAAGSNATVAIRGQLEQSFVAGADGRVVLIDVPQWQDPDLEVEFSEAPLRLLPYIDQRGTP